MREITIHRAPRDKQHPYMQLLRSIPQSEKMDLEERGLLIFMLSLPNNFEIRASWICQTQKIGEKKILRYFKKFESLGYMRRKQTRDIGKFSNNEYQLHEEPIEVELKELVPSGKNCRAAEMAAPLLPDGGNGEFDDVTYKEKNKISNENNISPIPLPESAPPVATKVARRRDCSIFSEEIKKLAQDVVGCIKEAKPDYCVPESLFSLMNSLELMVRKDNRSPERILSVLKWALSDYFWSSHMMKPDVAAYLRKKNLFDSLEQKMNSKPPKEKRKFAPSSDSDRAYQALLKSAENAL